MPIEIVTVVIVKLTNPASERKKEDLNPEH